MPTMATPTHPNHAPFNSHSRYCWDSNHSTCQLLQCKFTHHCKHVVPVSWYKFAQLLGALRLPTKPQPWAPIQSFLLECEISSHPNEVFVRQLIDNLHHQCSIGYTGPQFAISQINDFLHITRQWTPLPSFCTSVVGLVPKHDGGWCVIYHLSAPAGHCNYDFIDPLTYILSYYSIDDAYTITNKLEPGALLSKINVKDAFHLIPMGPADWNLLRIYWKQNFHIDTCLPFGLTAAPYLFKHLSSALHWILEHNYDLEYLLHYLDDLFTARPADSNEYKQHLNAMLTLCGTLNVHIKPSKVECPATSLTFLGIHLNTISMEVSITKHVKSHQLVKYF